MTDAHLLVFLVRNLWLMAKGMKFTTTGCTTDHGIEQRHLSAATFPAFPSFGKGGC